MTASFEAEVLQRLTRIEEKVQGVVETVSDLSHDLDGNGQPGIKRRLAVLETQVDERTGGKAQTFAISGGASVFVLAAFEAVKEWVLRGGN